ncbi:MAG: YraN family protein [Planctomycetia bacterium]|nr:YraN family protein [Planctomycetia bacterium]
MFWRSWWERLTRLWRPRHTLGRRGEDAAAQYLRAAGWKILERSLRYPCGELDLVALDGEAIVFVEVKTRSSKQRGLPADAIDRKKQSRTTLAALTYLKSRQLLDRRTRFDVVAILWSADTAEPEIKHYRAAFSAAGSHGMFS